MKKLLSLSFWRHVGSWTLTTVPVSVFVLAYLWLAFSDTLKYGTSHNLWLAVVALYGAVAAILFWERLCFVHYCFGWPKAHKGVVWTRAALIALGAWHIIGDVFASTPDERQFFVFGPLGLLAIFAVGVFIKYLMEAPDQDEGTTA